MGTIAQKLQNIIDSKAAISAAIEAKGGTVPTELTGYGAAIEALPSGGNELFLKMVEKSITEVTTSDLTGVTNIGNSAFSYCTALTSVTIPDGVTSIGDNAFYSCSKLTSITIPSGVTSIGNSMFYWCSALSSIAIPSSVTSIAMMAFSGCRSCSIFDFSNHTSVPTLQNTNAFSTTNANKKIIVPDALYETWKTTNNWNSSTNGIVDAITKASEA